MTILTQLQSISADEAGLAQAKNLLAGLSASVANAGLVGWVQEPTWWLQTSTLQRVGHK